MTQIRIQKVLQQAGIASRRKAEDLIQEGRVRVNGALVTQMGLKVDPESDAIKVDNKIVQLKPAPHVYLALNKPRGVICTHEDPEKRETCIDLLPSRYRKLGLTHVGRLDVQSEGLLLLSNDGSFVYKCTHPKFHLPKIYHVKARGEIKEALLDKLRKGIVLDYRRTLPCKIKRISRKGTKHTWLSVEVVEGRYHLIRKMFYSIGHGVTKVKRVQMGPIRLGPLKPGTLRRLTAPEIKLVTQFKQNQQRGR